jgi:flagellin-like protein
MIEIKMKREKKAVSPIIATIILISIVIILAVIIFIATRSFVKEAVLKNIAGEQKTVEKSCQELGLQSIINEDGSFGFSNTGNIPIYKINLKLTNAGSSEIIEIDPEKDSDKISGSFRPGSEAIIIYNNIKTNDYENIKIIPVLLGKTKKSSKTQEYVCPEENSLIIK